MEWVLETALVEIHSASSSRFLQVERYDRRLLANSRIERIHQEDFCQALGVVPELKYEQEGGPNLKKCFALVRAICSVPGPDLLRLFDSVVFNVLIGNCDAHTKNFSLLRDGDTIRLAPLYDLISTRAYPSLSREMAMKIGGERNPEKLGAKNWPAFYEQAGIGQAPARQRTLAVCTRVLESAESLALKKCPGSKAVLPIIREGAARISNLRL
jgi:serine/threonine-protein kinase HipA